MSSTAVGIIKLEIQYADARHRVLLYAMRHAFTAKDERPRTAAPPWPSASLAILQRVEVRLWKVGDSHYPAVELAVGERLERRGGLLGGRPG